MTTFHIENFGCRAARADGEAVSARLLAQGMQEGSVATSDVVVINTCSVTAEADRDARAFVRKTNRRNPEARIVVTGCYAQRVPEEIAGLEGVTAVVGNSHKGLVPEIIRDLLNPVSSGSAARTQQLIPARQLIATQPGSRIWADDAFAHSYIEDAQIHPGIQTRPNLKIQEGCSNRCTFCIIPTTRGFSRSLSAAKVLAQVEGFVAAGGKELVLSGINLGQWGRDLSRELPSDQSPRTLAQLIREILEVTTLPRLRLSSVEPMDWTPELIQLFSEYGLSRIARHAHLPLQSGSDAVLRRMHRRYRPWHYARKIEQLAAAVGPVLALGADGMVGFPGETDAEFQQTFDFIASLPFTYLHLFPFSARPGTPGWELQRQSPVDPQAVRERMAALQQLSIEKSAIFRMSFIGRELPAITLNTSDAIARLGRTAALTDNYLPVEISRKLPANELVSLRIEGVMASHALDADLAPFDPLNAACPEFVLQG